MVESVPRSVEAFLSDFIIKEDEFQARIAQLTVMLQPPVRGPVPGRNLPRQPEPSYEEQEPDQEDIAASVSEG